MLRCNCHSRHPRESGDPVDAGVGVYWFPAFAGMTAVQAAKMIATIPPYALQKYDFEAKGDWDIVAKAFGGIAERMGC